MTRLNVYAGPAGFYLLRGEPSDLPTGVPPWPAPKLGDLPGTKYYEIPIAVQDRSFNANRSLFYPSTREFLDGFGGPYIPGSDVSPLWNPEFFGNTMAVNGRTWPFLEVEPRRYRFRFLNGCNSRFLILKIVSDPLARRPARPALPFWQIGTEGGLLPAPVQLGQLLMGLAERADVIVDFTGLPVGTELYLINEGPDEPFGGGVPKRDFAAADPATTGQVMKFVVVPLASSDTSAPPDRLTLPTFTPLGAATKRRQVSLNEKESIFPLTFRTP
jgi:spore coat protein A, manganese oxidase